MITALAIIAAHLPTAPLVAPNTLWTDILEGRIQASDNRLVVLPGTIVSRARGSVFLLPNPPLGNAEDGWDFDYQSCVGLLVTPEQFARLRSGAKVTVSGELIVVDLSRGDSIITSISRSGRTAYPSCVSSRFLAQFIYVDRITEQ